MVKGVNRRVIIVPAPDPRYFDEAIFVLRSDMPHTHLEHNSPVVSEACRIARRCAQRHTSSCPKAFWILLGAAPVALAWLLTSL